MSSNKQLIGYGYWVLDFILGINIFDIYYLIIRDHFVFVC